MQVLLPRRLPLALLLPLAFAGCGGSGGGVAGPSVEVVASTSVLADFVRAVGGDSVAVAALVPEGADPHGFEPRPADLARVAKARALVVNGLGYEAWLAPSLGALGAARVVELGPAAGGRRGEDPHLWMDPGAVPAYLEAIRSLLAELHPDRAALFAANARAYDAKLAALDAELRGLFAALPEGRRVLVTNHEALGHFARAYGFRIAGTILGGPGGEAAPSARSLAALVGAIRDTGAPAVFLDAGENEALARSLAAETGVRVVTGLRVEALTAPGGPAPDYLSMIRYDAERILDALR